MKNKLLILTFLSLPLMVGSVFAMDSDAVKAHMEKISEQTQERTEDTSRVQALEEQVQELEALIQMMLDEEQQKTES